MAPLPRFRVSAFADLAGQLRFASREALLREIDRAEALAAAIDQARAYSEAELVQRLTGFRPSRGDDAMIPGDAALGDLSTLVAHLCEVAGCGAADLPEGCVGVETLQQRWSVSRKTVERYRRRGLMARWVVGADGQTRLAFTPRAVEAFERRLGTRLESAARFERMDEAMRARLIARARRYRARLGWSLNQAAARLAARFHRSHEGVRQVLLRHDESAREHGGAIFAPPAARGIRVRIAVLRGLRRGAEPHELALLLGDGDVSRRRVTHLALTTRVRLLHRLRLAPATSPLFTHAEARSVYLAPEAVRRGLMPSPARADDLALLALARGTRPDPADFERTRLNAMLFLLDESRRGLAALSRSAPTATAVDRIETDLRWAHRLRGVLLRSQIGVIVNALESAAGRGLDTMPASTRHALLDRALRSSGRVIDAHNPGHGGRLAAPIGLTVSRLVTRADPAEAPTNRATRRALSGGGEHDLTRLGATPTWSAWLLPPPALGNALETLDADDRFVLARRYGLDGEPPLTLGELALALNVPAMHAARVERRALRAALGG